MTSWIGHSVRRGIVTSRYPIEPASDDELPLTGGPLATAPGTLLESGLVELCPTRAISPSAIDQGACIRCARCFGHGLSPVRDAAASVGDREELRWPDGALPTRPRDSTAALRALGRSVHAFMIDVGSCQGCNLEVLGITGPLYDAHRLGIFFTNSPRHADLLVVVGVPTAAMVEPLRRTYEAMPGPKAVLAVGACAIDGGLFADSPARAARVADIVPVDRYVAGCPPAPISILEGILELMGRGRERKGGAP